MIQSTMKWCPSILVILQIDVDAGVSKKSCEVVDADGLGTCCNEVQRCASQVISSIDLGWGAVIGPASQGMAW